MKSDVCDSGIAEIFAAWWVRAYGDIFASFSQLDVPPNPDMATSPTAAHSSGSSNESIWDKHPSLEQLVEHFLASKGSLSAITHVSRAREIVDSGRQALEENAVLSAKNAFVKHAIHKQIEAFDAIRYGASIVDVEGNDEFQVQPYANSFSLLQYAHNVPANNPSSRYS